MKNWIITKVSYLKMADGGKVKRITEAYLVDALSFAEAEAKVIEELNSTRSESFGVSAVRKTKIADVTPSGDDGKWYEIKWRLITVDNANPSPLGKPVKERHITVNSLVQGEDLESALRSFVSSIDDDGINFEIISVAESAIIGIFAEDID